MDLYIIGLLPLAGLLVGWWITSQNYRDTARDRQELREERRFLLEENKRLTTTVFELERKVISLESRLATAMDQIAEWSSTLSRDETDTSG